MSPPADDNAPPDTVLVQRATAGDLPAFGALVSRHQRRIWMVCRSYLGENDADAAAQDAFVKAMTRLASFNGRSSFSTWLTRIAINTCLDDLRQKKRRGDRTPDDDDGAGLHELADDQVDPEERLAQRQAVSRLGQAERTLPERQRAVFRLRFYAQMELEEIAATLGVRVGTVKTQLHRAVHKVRSELGDVR